MNNDKLKIIILAVIVLALISNPAHAISIGVSPGKLNLYNVLRNGYAERSVTVSTGDDEEVIVTVKPSEKVKEWSGKRTGSGTFALTAIGITEGSLISNRLYP